MVTSFNSLDASVDQSKKILSLIIIKEVANNSPTHFYHHIETFKSKFIHMLRDKQMMVREVTADALSSCLMLLQNRENIKKNDYYYAFISIVEELAKDKRNEYIHGYLLGIHSFLTSTHDYCSSHIGKFYEQVQVYFNTKDFYIKTTIIRMQITVLFLLDRFDSHYGQIHDCACQFLLHTEHKE